METAPIELKIIPCPCGHHACNYWGLNIGAFTQGTGFDKWVAVEICLALVSRYPDRYSFDEAKAARQFVRA